MKSCQIGAAQLSPSHDPFVSDPSTFPAQTTVAQAASASTMAPVFLRATPLIQAALPEEFHDPLGQLRRWQSGLPVTPSLTPGAPKP